MPLPWKRTGPSFGFGAGGSHLPQPLWFGRYSVEAEQDDDASVLTLYRTALALRRRLRSAETLDWVTTSRDDVLSFRRPGGWLVVSNFGTEPFPLSEGVALLSSGPTATDLPGETTIWLKQ